MAAVEMAGPDRLELSEREIPPMQHGDVLVRIAYTGICGTDVELLNGRSAFVREGLIGYPFIFGHEWSGTVVACGRAR